MHQVLTATVLVLAGIYDAKTKEIPNVLPAMLLIIGCFFWSWLALAGLILVPLPAIFMLFLDMDSIGGGDIKLLMGLGFCAGPILGLKTLIFACFFALIVLWTKKSKPNRCAFAPYLAIGFLAALII